MKLNPNKAPPGVAFKAGQKVVIAKAGGKYQHYLAVGDKVVIKLVDGDSLSVKIGGATQWVHKSEVVAIGSPLPALDARITIRLPASVKAKAMRIGGAAVIAAIEAVEEGGAAC